MADLTEQQLLSQDPEVLGLQRQRQLANLLTGQAFNQPQGQVISGHYVAPSGLQQALPMINAAIGGLTNANLDTKQQELAAALRSKQQEAMQNYVNASQGTPAQMYQQQAGPMPDGSNIPQQVQTPATGPNYGEMFKAGTSQYASPQLQAAAYKLLEPITTKEGETVTQRNLGGAGGMTEISKGGIKLSQDLKDVAYQLGLDPAKADQWNPQQWNTVRSIQNQIDQNKRSVTNINMGQHGFDNTIKLGENFKSEPIYKTHQEVSQAYQQVNNALDKNNAAGDLAASIKINKLLDPNSVVRESEVATVANATGLLPKLQNYANKVMTGASLNPQQRKEYRQLAKDFYEISGNQYNETRNKYSQIGQQNQLNGTDTILGAPWKSPVVSNQNLTPAMQSANEILGIPSVGNK